MSIHYNIRPFRGASRLGYPNSSTYTFLPFGGLYHAVRNIWGRQMPGPNLAIVKASTHLEERSFVLSMSFIPFEGFFFSAWRDGSLASRVLSFDKNLMTTFSHANPPQSVIILSWTERKVRNVMMMMIMVENKCKWKQSHQCL